jgi:GT2 family glycosyltransferase
LSQSVAVLIVSYNSAQLLKDTLGGLSRQTFRNFSTLVLDNGSHEEPVEENFPGVEVVRLPKNIGFAGANNRGIELCARSRWIALLNPDAIPAVDWLEKLVAAAEEKPAVACFASRMIQAERPDVLDGAGDAYHVSGRVWRRGHGVPTAGYYSNEEEVFSACAAAALYRRDLIEAVGKFDEDFFCYLEDVDLGFRLRLAGHRCLYVPDAVAYHVGSATTGKNSDFAVYHGHRNLVWTYVKNMPGWLFWLYLPQHVAANLYIIARYAFQGRGRIILKAKWDAIKKLPQMWQKRSAIQARRAVGAWEIRSVMEKGWPRRRQG